MKLSGPSRMLTRYAASFDMTLRRRCAQAVARHRVLNNAPLKNTSLLALGKKRHPGCWQPKWKPSIPTNATKHELRGLARLVPILLYAQGTNMTAVSGDAAASAPTPKVAL
jgi:hypothetical protein